MTGVAKHVRLTRIAEVWIKNVMVVFFDWDNETTYPRIRNETRIAFSVRLVDRGTIDTGQVCI